MIFNKEEADIIKKTILILDNIPLFVYKNNQRLSWEYVKSIILEDSNMSLEDMKTTARYLLEKESITEDEAVLLGLDFIISIAFKVSQGRVDNAFDLMFIKEISDNSFERVKKIFKESMNLRVLH